MSDHTEESEIRKEFGDHECPTCGTQCADTEDLYNKNQAELQALRQENARLKGALNEAIEEARAHRADNYHVTAYDMIEAWAAALSSSPAQEEKK